jgi:hypothetical protein
MRTPELVVRHVAGRYGRGAVRSQNIVTSVTEVARVFRVRIDDDANPDAWLELTIEVETREAGQRPASTAAG